MAKVLISLDDDLLRRIDRAAAGLGMTRSAYLARLARTQVDGASGRSVARVRRSIDRVRALSAEVPDDGVGTTEFLRRMRDERRG